MKKFNINDSMYIKITDAGWKYLKKTVDDEYITYCIKSREKIINGQTWYKLQCWDCFNLMPPNFGGFPLFETNVMFDDEDLEEI
jgi:hypothetical protein